jgi:hypothetical protein
MCSEETKTEGREAREMTAENDRPESLLQAQLEHLVAGLQRIVALKDMKQVKDPIVLLSGVDDTDDEGWSAVHPSMKKGLDHASHMATEILDSMPK